MSGEPPRNRHAGWRHRMAEIDRAAAADAATAEQSRQTDSQRVEAGYASPLATLIGFAVVVALVLLCLFVIQRLETDPLSSDCAFAHGRNC
jgi:hypothetical protein